MVLPRLREGVQRSDRVRGALKRVRGGVPGVTFRMGSNPANSEN